MYEAYFDDSGTDASCPLAVAACYVSTKRSWTDFEQEWNAIRKDEGFDIFHMSDFALPRTYGKKPFCEWSPEKKERVYGRLADVINQNKRRGFGVAVPKNVFDAVVPQIADPSVRKQCGEYHYTFAVKTVLVMIARWRESSCIALPMKYIFDRINEGRKEIETIFDEMDTYTEDLIRRLGLEPGGYAVEPKDNIPALQAADILAWQMNWHMRKVILAGKDDVEHVHPNFRVLRNNQAMTLAFMTEANFRNTIDMRLRQLDVKQQIVGAS